MRAATFVLGLALCAGCGGGGSAPADTGNSGLTVQELIESCLAGDLQELAALLEVVQGLLDDESGAPLPQFDILSGLLTGTFPWTLDLNDDGTPELRGTLRLTGADGQPLSAGELAALVAALGGGIDSLADFFAVLPDGTTLHLTFMSDGLLLQQTGGGGATGDGAFTVEFEGGQPSSASGNGTFESGACSFSFEFADLDLGEIQVGSFGVASASFDLVLGDQSLGGSIELDGTNVAVVTASLDGGVPQVFRIDLETGGIVGAP